MKKTCLLALFCLVSGACCHAQKSHAHVKVEASGETLIETASGESRVRVTIRTRVIVDWNAEQHSPYSRDSSCTGGRTPCSVVDVIEVTANGVPIFVPRSVFCDLGDVNAADLAVGAKPFSLRLTGGDASESYVVKIEFDAKHIARRTLLNPALPNKPLEETVYYTRHVG
jgi:hypothetical protein